jgi:hypothetical protein
MRVVVQVSAHYDWEKIPSDVDVKPADIKSGRVKPAANGGYTMKVTRKRDTTTLVGLSEETIIQRIIHEMMPNQGGVPHSRVEAVGQIMARQVMGDHAHPKFMKGFIVETDDGPDEALFRKLVTPFTVTLHDASGEPLIAPEDLEPLVAKYMEKTTPQDHVNHLHDKFHVKKLPAVSAPEEVAK